LIGLINERVILCHQACQPMDISAVDTLVEVKGDELLLVIGHRKMILFRSLSSPLSRQYTIQVRTCTHLGLLLALGPAFVGGKASLSDFFRSGEGARMVSWC
jgi:hypothetical protein